jgi:predicted ATPase
VPPTSLVDRENELARTQQLLGDGTRLVTLTGAGGIGKSRLAVEVASRLASSFPDGAWFVPLAAVSAPEEVAAVVARALGLRRSGDQAPVEDLTSYLRDRRLLLVLDNFEQVADAAPMVAEVLAAAPQVQALVTSRTVLRLSGEYGVDVPPLAAPWEGAGLGAEEARRYPAVQLFVARAAAAKQDFVLSDANAADVAEICRRLDGLPLALELAAARIRLLTPQALRSRLDDRLGLLAGGARDLPERQRTLRDTIAWSHDLLTSDQQEVFARLGVFAGGFDLAAAAAVCGTDVLDVLGALVDGSLVRQADKRGEPRFSLLDTIRQFALERLRETADWREAHDRHADHYLALARAAEPELKGPNQLEWLDRLDTEAGNLDAAMTRFLATDRIESAVGLSWALWLYWWFHGHVEDGGRWMEEILTRSGSLPELPSAWAASGAGVMAFARGDYRRAEDLLARGLALFRRLEVKPGIAGALIILGQLATFRGEYDRARELLEESLALFRELGEDWNVAIVLNFLGAIPLNQDDHHRAEPFFTEALAVARRLGDRLAIRVSLYNLASVRRALADDRGARDLLLEGLRLSADAGDQASVAYGLEGLGSIEQEPGRAARLFGAAEALLEAQGGAPVYAYTSDRTGRDLAVETLRSRTDDTVFTTAWTHGRGMAARQAVEYALAPVESSTAAPEPGRTSSSWSSTADGANPEW